MEAMLNDAISTINGYLWSYFIIFILIGAGLFFTMTTNFVQIRMIKEMIRLVINLVALVLFSGCGLSHSSVLPRASSNLH